MFISGISAARKALTKLRPNIVFSKGGFVGLPVVIAARSLGIPTIIHESDISPGLANRLSIPFATKVCVSFPETLTRVPKSKGILTGTPIRENMLMGDPSRGRALCGSFPPLRPMLLILGGSSGSLSLNKSVFAALVQLRQEYDIAHIVGNGNLSPTPSPKEPAGAYAQFEYLKEDLPDIFAAADIAVSRAGANTLQELLAARKPSLLVPLVQSSRGDQLQNATSFTKRGLALMLPEEELTPTTLVSHIRRLYLKRKEILLKMAGYKHPNGSAEVIKVILGINNP